MWHRIALLGFICFTFGLYSAPVAVIRGYNSLPAGERRFAQSLARHVERWYQDVGVPVTTADDSDIATALRNKKVAVLVYLAETNQTQYQALRRFVQQGGKLIVCYSSSQELAALMGVRTVGYRRSTQDGAWSAMHFTNQAPQGTPAVIRQSSSNLMLVEPISGKSVVAAWWHNRSGQRMSEPAWLKSSAGYWMTHVLSGDGDARGKAQLLLAMAAQFDPDLWHPAASSLLSRSRNIGGGVANMQKLAGSTALTHRLPTIRNAMQRIMQKDNECRKQLAVGRGYEAWQTANDLRERMYELYGLLQSKRGGEIRAVWDHSGMGLYPGEWGETCQLLKNAGFTDIYVNVAGAGFSHCKSQVLPCSRVFEEHGDQLAACLKAAQATGLRVHAWLLCFTTEGATPARLEVFNKNGWLLTKSDGSVLPWLDPGSPAVRAYLLRAVEELATNYNVAGVHLDFVRYPDFDSSLGSGTRQRFERSLNTRVEGWPATVKSGSQRTAFIRWRGQQVTDFVADAKRTMRRNAPHKLLTVAVFGKYPSCYHSVGQDWESWININLVDYVVPMNYTDSLSQYNEWLTFQTRRRQQALRVLPGIGVTAAESRLDAAQVIDQIQLARRAGCPGFALFNLDITMCQSIMPVLRLGVCAP